MQRWDVDVVSLWYAVHKDIDKVDALYFLGRSLLFAGGDEDKIAEVARILAAFSLYSFINLEASSRSLMLYH